MSLKTFVKVSSVTNLSDARYCAGMGVNLIGFNVEEDHENYIDPSRYEEITAWLSGVEYVGEFEKSNASTIQKSIDIYNPNYIEISDLSTYNKLDNVSTPKILKIDIDTLIKHNESLTPPDYILIENQDLPLTDEQQKALNKLSTKFNILIGSGITESNVEGVLNFTNAKGIALKGGSELRPGYKDYDELADILEALEEEL